MAQVRGHHAAASHAENPARTATRAGPRTPSCGDAPPRSPTARTAPREQQQEEEGRPLLPNTLPPPHHRTAPHHTPPTCPSIKLDQVGLLESSKSGMYTLAPLHAGGQRAQRRQCGARGRTLHVRMRTLWRRCGTAAGKGGMAFRRFACRHLCAGLCAGSDASCPARPCAPLARPRTPPNRSTSRPPVERVDHHLAVGGTLATLGRKGRHR